MAVTTGTFYINAATFATATALYTSQIFIPGNLAPDGWYSVNGEYRQQVAGVLGAITDCPNCNPDCVTVGTAREVSQTYDCVTVGTAIEVITPPVFDCLDGLIVETIYLDNLADIPLLKPEYVAPPNTPTIWIGTHQCNRALFEVFGNGVYIGASKLNNDGGVAGIDVSPEEGIPVCQDFVNRPDDIAISSPWTGSVRSRYSKTILTAEQALDIALAGVPGSTTITFLIRGVLSYVNSIPRPVLLDCGGVVSHLDVTWVRISLSDGTVVYNGLPPVGTFGTIDVCTPL
jgi:hypothetical protein